MTEIPNHPVYHKNVIEMLTVANDFCLTMDKSGEMSKTALMNYLQKISPLLYIKGSLLPEIEVSNPDANERFLTEEKWEWLFNELRKKFGNNDEFWYVDSLEKNQPDPIKGSMAEYFTDIYQDMKDFLELYQKSSLAAKENAVHELKRSFEKRWGYRNVVAHKALHYVLMNNTQNEELFDYPSIF
ncbi:MAG: DUF5063 domain-containing protein [Bacteroidales bacterium]